jgi:hypothetical protein
MIGKAASIWYNIVNNPGGSPPAPASRDAVLILFYGTNKKEGYILY